MGILIEETLSSNANSQIVIDDDNELGLMAVRLANAAAFPMVLKAALELGVFDTLYAASVFLSPSEIASRLPTTPRNPEAPALLDRMLRLLASYSMVKCGTVQAGKGQRVYKAEPICRFFLKDNIQDIGSLASQVIVNFDSVFLNTWAQLKDVVLEGGDAFGRAHGGMKLFDYMGTDERFSKLFNQTGFTIAVVKKALEVYQGFKDVDVLVDVGGGVGNTLAVVTSKYPNIKGINFDLTCALAQAPSYPRVEHVAGDMFVDVPTGDAMILKRILHDWTDEDCVKILKNCWKSLPENGKVVVIELVTPDNAESGDINSNIAFDMDMLMFTQCSGGKATMAGLLKTPSLPLTPSLTHAPSVPFKPFCVSFAGGRRTSFSLSRRASLRSVSGGGYRLRLLNFVPFASGEAETTETEVQSSEPEVQETDGAEGENAGAEEEEAAVTIALLSSYKEALAENNEEKIAEIEASLKSIEDEKFQLQEKAISLSNELTVERDRLIRISADFDNFRKRNERERLNLVSNAQGEVVENLLAVLDNFERAKSQIKVETEGEEKVTNSYQSIYKQFVEILGSLGVVTVETVGKQFDPMLHEAIMREDSAEYEEGIVLEEYRKGFLLGERLLRPSMVKVSAGPGPEKAGETEGEVAVAQGSAEGAEAEASSSS